jgi:hypothetical protein
VTHYTEFDIVENPKENYWCAHAALKMMTKYKLNKYYSLPQIHSIFYDGIGGKLGTTAYHQNECPTGFNKPGGIGFCGNAMDIYYGAKGLGLNVAIASVSRKTPAGQLNYAGLLDAIKTGTKTRNAPVIAFGDYMTSARSTGHAWVIVGYNTDGITNPKDAWVFLRNSVRVSPSYPEMDDWVTVEKFYQMMSPHNGNVLSLLQF